MKQNLKNRALAWALMLCMAVMLSFVPQTANAATVNVSTNIQLRDALQDNTTTVINVVTDDLRVSTNVALGGNKTINMPNDFNMQFLGVISGGYSFTINGGNLWLENSNTYTGDTIISGGGTMILGSATSSIAGNIVLNQGRVSFSRSGDYEYSGNISGDGTVSKGSAGKLTLSGINTYTGTTSVMNGTLEVTGSIASNVSLSSGMNIIFNPSADLTYGGRITGAGGNVTKAGPNRLILTNTSSSTYGGNTYVTGGTLQVGNGVSGNIPNGWVSLSAGSSIDFNPSGSLAFSGEIHGNGRVVKSGAGTLSLTGFFNTYSGGTVVTGGLLSIGANLLPSGMLTLDGGTVEFDINVTAYNFNRDITLGSNGGTIDITPNTKNISVGGVVSGSGSLTKTGAGTLTLAGTNTYSGETAISAGTLEITGSLGGGVYSRNITNNGTLTFNQSGNQTLSGAVNTGTGRLIKNGTGTLTIASNFTHNGGTTVNAGTLQIGNGGAEGGMTGNITNNANVTFSRSNNTTYGGVISGTGSVTKEGTGTLTLSYSSTYTGNTTVNAGNLVLGGTNTVSAGQTFTIGANSVVTVNGSLTNNGTVTNNGLIVMGAGGTTNLNRLTLNANGGTGTITVAEPGTVFDLNKLTTFNMLPTNGTRALEGWNTAASGGTDYATNASVPTSVGTIYAQWAATAPAITTATLPRGTNETAYSQTLAATGTTPITWSITAGSLPTGLSLNSATGAITGTPTVGTRTTFNFTVQAQNSAGTDTKALSIEVLFVAPLAGCKHDCSVTITCGGPAACTHDCGPGPGYSDDCANIIWNGYAGNGATNPLGVQDGDIVLLADGADGTLRAEDMTVTIVGTVTRSASVVFRIVRGHIKWQASVTSTSNNNSSAVRVSKGAAYTGTETFEVVGGLIESTGNSSAIIVNAVDATVSGGTVRALNTTGAHSVISLTDGTEKITVSGGTVIGGTSAPVIRVDNSNDNHTATVTVSGGMVTGAGTTAATSVINMTTFDTFPAANTSAVNVTVSGTGKVIATGSGGHAIHTPGSVRVSGTTSEVSAAAGSAIRTSGANSTVIVSGGTVKNTANGIMNHTINMAGSTASNTVNVTVDGGKVFADGTVNAIETQRRVVISGAATEVRASAGAAVLTYGTSATILISGGTVTGNVDATGTGGAVTVSGGIVNGTFFRSPSHTGGTINGNAHTGTTPCTCGFCVPADTTPPTVVSVTPTGTGAALSGNVVITFDKMMNSADGTVQLNGTTLSTILGGWSAGNTVYTISYSGLAGGTTYTVSISGFRSSPANVSMGADNSHSFTTASATTASVRTFTELQTAINDFNTSATGDTTIIITADFEITSRLTISNTPYKLTIKSDGTTRTLTRGWEDTDSGMFGGMFINGSFSTGVAAHLILENIIIDGNKALHPGNLWNLILNWGTLTLNDGAVLQNNIADYGGAVWNNGTLNIDGGIIRNNKANFNGGGIYMNNPRIINMTGGEISGNEAGNIGGGVDCNGTFTMSGGRIINNKANNSSGVFIDTSSTFDMTGGLIFGIGISVINGGSYSNNAVRINWLGTPGTFDEGSTVDDLSSQYPGGITAVWAIENGKHGMRYTNGDNISGFVEVDGVTVGVKDLTAVTRIRVTAV